MSDEKKIGGDCKHGVAVAAGYECKECASESAAPTGSGTYYPRAIRLVLQLEDTPENRRTVELAKREIEKCTRVVHGRGVLKLEEINMLSVSTAKPCQNAELTDRRKQP